MDRRFPRLPLCTPLQSLCYALRYSLFNLLCLLDSSFFTFLRAVTLTTPVIPNPSEQFLIVRNFCFLVGQFSLDHHHLLLMLACQLINFFILFVWHFCNFLVQFCIEQFLHAPFLICHCLLVTLSITFSLLLHSIDIDQEFLVSLFYLFNHLVKMRNLVFESAILHLFFCQLSFTLVFFFLKLSLHLASYIAVAFVLGVKLLHLPLQALSLSRQFQDVALSLVFRLYCLLKLLKNHFKALL